MPYAKASQGDDEKHSSQRAQPVRLRADAQRNRNQLVMAAREMFATYGITTPLETIAQHAQVGIGTLYRHFPDRHHLVRAVARDVLESIAEEARQALAEEPNAFDALKRYMHRALDLRVGVVMPVLFHQLALDGEEVEQVREEVTSVVQTIIDRAKEAGDLRSDIAFGDIGVLIIRLATPLADVIPADVNDRLAHRHLDIVLDGLRGVQGWQRGPLAEPALTLHDLHALSRT